MYDIIKDKKKKTLWTLNPAIRVQISVEPKLFYFRQISSFQNDGPVNCIVSIET